MPAMPFSKTRRIGSTLDLPGEIGFADDRSIAEGIEAQTQLFEPDQGYLSHPGR